MSDLRTALEMKIAKWRKPNTGHLTESERDIAEGFERAADELEALLASESAPPAPVLPHWCDKIWDRLRCRTCRAEAWNIEEMHTCPACGAGVMAKALPG